MSDYKTKMRGEGMTIINLEGHVSRRLGTGHVTRAKVCDFGGKEVHEKTTKPSTLRVPGISHSSRPV